MRFALVNPRWSFEGSIYFGCREPHLPIEFGYARALLQARGHDVELIDGHMQDLSPAQVRQRLADFGPDYTVLTTAPSYLFWRCPQPELRVPREAARALKEVAGALVAVGPHPSTTPRAALRKLGADLVIMGEFEAALPLLGRVEPGDWEGLTGVCYRRGSDVVVRGTAHAADVASLPPLGWEPEMVRRHGHHHHRFDAPPVGPGAEMEASRGCPYRCSFCAKQSFRGAFRRRPLPTVLAELDGLLAQGVEYVYFVDEIFMPDVPLLEALAQRPVKFGIQTRIDVWDRKGLDLLGRAGCCSIEAGVESVSAEGRDRLGKHCRLSTAEIVDLLAHAKGTVPFVQASLVQGAGDDPEAISAWRSRMLARGVWANEPVPLFPYPGSPDYTKLWGQPDDLAWERAYEHYIEANARFSDIQDSTPLPLAQLESMTDGG